MSSGNPETRKKILDAAWTLLEAAGGGDVRMSDIAREAGVSRQAIYLHFPARAELLAATTRHIDEVKDVEGRLVESRTAATGRQRLSAFIEAWGNYLPEIHGVATALIRLSPDDDAAREAWADRLRAVRDGCRAAIEALEKDGDLSPAYTAVQATDLLCTLLSVQVWEQLTAGCGWTQEAYVEEMQSVARRLLVAH